MNNKVIKEVNREFNKNYEFIKNTKITYDHLWDELDLEETAHYLQACNFNALQYEQNLNIILKCFVLNPFNITNCPDNEHFFNKLLDFIKSSDLNKEIFSSGIKIMLVIMLGDHSCSHNNDTLFKDHFMNMETQEVDLVQYNLRLNRIKFLKEPKNLHDLKIKDLSFIHDYIFDEDTKFSGG